MSKQRKARRVKYMGLLIIIFGIGIAAYPFVSNMFTRLDSPSYESPAEIKQSAPKEKNRQEDFGEMLLEIPAINLSTQVVKGTSEENLKIAPGWYEESALPGQGNTAIAGHRSMYGGEFRYLDRLKAGEKMLLTSQGTQYIYEVEEVLTIESNDWSVIDSCGYDALTLTTCHSLGRNKRLAVRGRLVSEKTVP